MRRILFVFGVIVMVGLGACKPNRTEKTLISRDFPTSSWERFDYVEKAISISEPVSFDLELEASFEDAYPYNYFETVFTVFDDADNALRTKKYKFNIKDNDGQWKSELTDGCYHFRFPSGRSLDTS